MNEHEQYADELALYAMGLLQGDAVAPLEKHLAGCAACRRELDALRDVTAMLAISSPPVEAPPHARQRLLSAVMAEPRPGRTPQGERAADGGGWARRSLWSYLPGFAAAVLALVAVLLWNAQTGLRRQVADLTAQIAHAQEQLQRASEVVATLADPAAARFTLSAAKAPPQPQAKTIYARNRGSLIFLASNMPALPPGKTYELWLIPAAGAPIPAGLFAPDAQGAASVIDPPLPAGVEAKTFAISVEPASGSPAPTTTPIMVGVGG